jgi:hypothetical protein
MSLREQILQNRGEARDDGVSRLAYSPWADDIVAEIIRALSCVKSDEAVAVAKNGLLYRRKIDNDCAGGYISSHGSVGVSAPLLAEVLYRSDGLLISAIKYRFEKEGVVIKLAQFSCGPRFVITLP